MISTSIPDCAKLVERGREKDEFAPKPPEERSPGIIEPSVLRHIRQVHGKMDDEPATFDDLIDEACRIFGVASRQWAAINKKGGIMAKYTAYEVKPSYMNPDPAKRTTAYIHVCAECYKAKHKNNPTAHRVRASFLNGKPCDECGEKMRST